MGALFTILFCLSLIASAYFLLRLIILILRKQPLTSYKKKLGVSAAILTVSLIGISMVPNSKEQLAAKREKFQIETPADGEMLYEQRLQEGKVTEKTSVATQNTPTPHKELTPKEKAAEEAKRKAEEEKRIAEQQAAAEKKVQEESNIQAEEERRASLLESGVQINYTIEKLSEHKYKVRGTTNLPDGMEIMISLGNRYLFRTQVMGISDEETDNMAPSELQYLIQNTFSGDSKRKIKQGTFETTFGENNRLLSGEYELIISSPLSSLQPKEVQTILGKNGENLFGMGVVESNIGGGKVIHLIDLVYLP